MPEHLQPSGAVQDFLRNPLFRLRKAADMADVGFGHSITFQTGFFACIRVTNITGITRESIDTSCSNTSGGHMTFMPSDLHDFGSLEIEMLFDPEEKPPIDQAAESVTLTFPIKSGDTNPATWAFSGFMTDFSGAVPYNDVMTASATIKVSGDITVTAGS